MKTLSALNPKAHQWEEKQLVKALFWKVQINGLIQ